MNYITQRRIVQALKECGISHTLLNVAMTQEEVCIKTSNVQAVVALSEIMGITINALNSEGEFFVIESGVTKQYKSYQDYCISIIPDVVTKLTKRQGETCFDACLSLNISFFEAKKNWPFSSTHRGLRVTLTNQFVVVDQDGLASVPVYGRRPEISEGLSPEEIEEMKQIGVNKVDLQKFGGHKFHTNDEPSIEMVAKIMNSNTFRFWRELYGYIKSPSGTIYSFGRASDGLYCKRTSNEANMDLSEWLDH